MSQITPFRPKIPYASTDVVSQAQNTFSLPPDAVIAFVHPRKYANPSFSASLLNLGPGAVSVRWDGQDATFGDAACILLPSGIAYKRAIALRCSMAADSQSATVSVSVDPYYG